MSSHFLMSCRLVPRTSPSFHQRVCGGVKPHARRLSQDTEQNLQPGWQPGSFHCFFLSGLWHNNYSVFKGAAAAAGATSAFPTPSRKRRTVFLLYMHEKTTVLKGRSVQHSTGRLSLRLASYLLLFIYFFTVSIDFKISKEKQQLQWLAKGNIITSFSHHLPAHWLTGFSCTRHSQSGTVGFLRCNRQGINYFYNLGVLLGFFF